MRASHVHQRKLHEIEHAIKTNGPATDQEIRFAFLALCEILADGALLLGGMQHHERLTLAERRKIERWHASYRRALAATPAQTLNGRVPGTPAFDQEYAAGCALAAARLRYARPALAEVLEGTNARAS